jgi:hypothetical protein
MTDFHALDLSGDCAALHRWDGRGWYAVAAAPIGEGQSARALADLLAPVAGLPVAVAVPPERVGMRDVDSAADVVSPTDARVDWIARDGGGWRFLTLPRAALEEIEAFLRALGVVPGGCMAETGAGLPPAWFGTIDSDVMDARATDRPPCLGPASPAPTPQGAAAKQRAKAAAQRDPAHLTPLPDTPDTDETHDVPRSVARLHGLLRWHVARPVVAGVLLLAVIAGGLGVLRNGGPQGPVDHTPDVATLAVGPTELTAPMTDGPATPVDRPARAVAPVLDPVEVAGTRAAPQPARQPTLSAMDAPPGMLPAATFYTPPFGITDTATQETVTLIIPGLDPVFRTDALALEARTAPTREPGARRTITAPAPPDEVYVVDARGLIRPSPEGRLSPDGFMVVAGQPPADVRPRPETLPDAPETVLVLRRADLSEDDPLRSLMPRTRPAGLSEARERDQLGGRTATELATFTPVRRPESAQELAGSTVTAPTVALGPRPAPRNAAVIARAQAAAQQPTGPAIAAVDVARVAAPTPSRTADRATAKVGINLSEINLLGTFGASSNRRALVRLPSGRVVNLSVGDRVDGGRVQEIGDGRLGYVKSGRTVTLRMPRG